MKALRSVLAAGLALAAGACGAAEDVRPAAAAGTFYPGQAAILRAQVEGFLSEAAPTVPDELQGQRPAVLIVPHAGYPYSGTTAAACYKLLEGKPKPSRIVLIGPTHRAWLPGACSVADFSHYATPLGEIPVDVEARDRLVDGKFFRKGKGAHQAEHCLEVQLPFLQVVWPETPVILPVLVGQLTAEDCRSSAGGIARALDEDTLLIVSTDFTHYGRRFDYVPFGAASGLELRDKIQALDMEGVEHIKALDPAGFRKYLDVKRPTICGRMAVLTMLEVFSKSSAVRPVFLKWRSSGAATGSYTDSVSYVAMALYASKEAMDEVLSAPARAAGAAPVPLAAPSLTEPEERALLKLARDAIGGALEQDAAQPEPEQVTDALRAEHGAFVTLRKNGDLRGCIGHVVGTEELWTCVRQVAVQAAFHDRRFPALKSEELADVKLEISVMGPLIPVLDKAEISVGRDGLIVRRGARSGLLLPQVATEYGWTVEEFLQQTCRKAGLPPDAWQQPDTMILRFGATVFGEEELGL